MLKRLAALIAILGILLGAFLLVLFFRISPAGPEHRAWEQLFAALPHFWSVALIAGAVFLGAALVPAMHTLFPPPPPPPDPQLLATVEDGRRKICDLENAISEGERRQLAFQAEATRAQTRITELEAGLAHATNELHARTEKDRRLADERARALERCNELNLELIEVSDQRKRMMAERDQAIRDLAETRAKLERALAATEAARGESRVDAADAGESKTRVAPDAAFQILYLLQKEGRLLDFLAEDLSGVDDDQLGGAVRPIHEGLRRLLDDRLVIAPVLDMPEGEMVDLGETVHPERVKLTGAVPSRGPYRGVLVHRGWRLKECRLPVLVAGWSGDVVVPAEVEVS